MFLQLHVPYLTDVCVPVSSHCDSCSAHSCLQSQFLLRLPYRLISLLLPTVDSSAGVLKWAVLQCRCCAASPALTEYWTVFIPSAPSGLLNNLCSSAELLVSHQHIKNYITVVPQKTGALPNGVEKNSLTLQSALIKKPQKHYSWGWLSRTAEGWNRPRAVNEPLWMTSHTAGAEASSKTNQNIQSSSLARTAQT